MPTSPAKNRKYDVNSDTAPNAKVKNNVWCGYRVVVMLGTVISMLIYTVGAILTGVAYRSWDMGVNCTYLMDSEGGGSVLPITEKFGYNTPIVVVGPVLMGVGGTIVAVLLLQWCFCRPALTHTYTL